jgi:oxygen-independent coproporphyrinogen-3 oxidase
MAGLYIHVPFCTQKCSYCDFFSAPPAGDQLKNWHLLLQRNLELVAPVPAAGLETIFFGGGTPSLLSPAQVRHVVQSSRSLFEVAAEAEISLEANPCSLSANTLEGYLAAGVNRLSLGIQSFDDQALHLLGRKHNAAQAREVFQLARAVGFANISVDLIFALPQQGIAALHREIEQLLDLAPDHIGIYGLSVETGTPLERLVQQGRLAEIDEETYAAGYLYLSRSLVAAGYQHYEISNFARPGRRCRHNQSYWQRKPCLAVGAGAHAYLPNNYGRRTAIPRDIGRYQRQLAAGTNPAELLEEFDRQQAMAETLYLALRTSDGLERAGFLETFGCSPAAFQALKAELHFRQGRYFFGPEQWLIYDHLISHFL